MKSLLAVLVLSLFQLASARDVQVVAHWIEMSQEAMTALLGSEKQDERIFTAARKLIAAGEARSFDTVVQRLKVGEKSLAESKLELIYPTEPEPPEGGPMGGGTKGDLADSSIFRVPPVRLPLSLPAFETRCVGLIGEIEVSLGANDSLEVRHQIRHAFHLRDIVLEEPWVDGFGNRHSFKLPSFSELSHDAVQVVRSGTWAFVGVQSLPDAGGEIEPGRKLLFFIKADLLNE